MTTPASAVFGTPPASTPAAPAAPAATPTPAAPATPASWYSGFTPERQELVMGKGWKGPEDALESYSHLEKMIGVPAERAIKLPMDPADPAWANEVWPKLGRPATPDKYDFGDVKPPDGGFDLLTPFRGKAHELGLSQTQAKGMQEWFDGTLAEAQKAHEETRVAELESKKTAAQAAIQKEYGAAFDEANLAVESAISRFKIGAELLEAMVQNGGHKEVFTLLAEIGKAMGEHRTPASGGGDGSGAFNGSPEWARSEISKLRGDPAFMKAWMAGDKHAGERMQRLHDQAFPGA